MGFSRKYIINSVNIRPSGVTTGIFQKTYNLLHGFSGQTILEPFLSFEYEEITLDQLSQMSDDEYAERSSHFVQFAFVDSGVDYDVFTVQNFIDIAELEDIANCP